MNIFKNSIRLARRPLSSMYSRISNISSIHEPPYLDIKPDIPVYNTIYIHLKHYDFVILEKYEQFLHKYFLKRNIVVENYPIPAHVQKIRQFVPCSEKVKDEVVLHKYHRLLTVSNIKSTLFPVYMEMLIQNLPECLEMSLCDFDPDIDEFRYVPTLEVDALKEQSSLLDMRKF